MSKISWDSTQVDVRADVKAAMTDDLHIVYVPLAAGRLANAISELDPNAIHVSCCDILHGNTSFDKDKMVEYSKQWMNSNIPSCVSDIYIAHITQESVDSIARKISDGTVVTITEIDDVTE